MKKLFWFGLLGLFLFEIVNVYFIMPMPGSQDMNSIDAAYFLHRWRWIFRGLFGLMILAGFFKSKWTKRSRGFAFIATGIVVIVTYMANFQLAADHMFYQPNKVLMATAAASTVDSNRLVIGVEYNGQAKAYPIQYLGFHHQVQDTIGGKPIMVTYCTVCRTGRVFEPLVNGKQETFRLVGMDHFNAMFEDATTKSWWRQVTGEAIAGKLKGQQLPEVFSTQTSLTTWLGLHPNTLIMQADSSFIDSYSKDRKYESGQSRDALTGTDTVSWKNKSWVIGVKAGKDRKVYDWIRLKEERIIQENIGNTPITLILANDNRSFFAFERPDEGARFHLGRDTITYNTHHFRIDGKGIDTSYSLKPLPAYQEFWHSWRTFNPGTLK